MRTINLPALFDMTSPEYYDTLTTLIEEVLQPHARYEVVKFTTFNDTYELSLGKVLASMILVYPFQKLGFEADESIIIREELDNSTLNKTLSDVITLLYADTDVKELNEAIGEVLTMIAYTSTEMTAVNGASISIKSLFEMSDESPEIWDLLNWDIPDGLQFNEIEQLVNEKSEDLFKLIRGTGNTEYGRLLRADSVINLGQFKQSALNISLKPDLLGKVIPEPINTSFLRGLRNYTDVFINAISARKALINNFLFVSKSGYLARKLVLLVSPCQIDKTVEDCGTRHLLYCDVHSAQVAKRLIGRYYYEEGADGFNIVETHNYHDIIGKEIFLRSPTRCALNTVVCKTCYGQMSKSNSDIHAGILGSLEITEQLTQRLLATKHLLKTDSVIIDWPDVIKDQFVIDKASLVLSANTSQLIIKKDDINDTEGGKTVTKFTYQKRTGREQYTVESPVPLEMTDVLFELAIDDKENGEYVIKVPASQTESFDIFNFTVDNNELTATLVSVFSLIETEENEDLDIMFNEFLARITAAGINTPSVNVEMILRSLVRDPNDITSSPDYSNDELPVEVILKLIPAIINSPSITNSLAFERIKSQLLQPITYRKTQKGVFDILFK